jgi:hypothetical protein
VPHRALRSTLVHTVLAAFATLAGGCSGMKALGIQQKDGLQEVDELLSHVERLQVEAAVTKERTQAAVEGLRVLVAPEFKGDPIVAHGEFEATVELVEDQADALRKCVKPLRSKGERVFNDWAANLESFGNLAMRQRSQERLEETRKRYDAILASANLAQLALDAFHGDLADQALFLEHDFNSSSVALVAQELEGLRSRGRELAKRLDGAIAACRAYVEFSAPGAQVAPEESPEGGASATPSQEPAPAPSPAPKKPVKKKPLSQPAQSGTAPAQGG